MKKLSLLGLVMIVLFCNPALAEEQNNSGAWFVKLGMGYAKPVESYDETNFNTLAWDFDGGINGALSIGYEYKRWALEAEVSYRKLGAGKVIDRTTSAENSLDGDQTQLTGMINGYFILLPKSRFRPYFGIGAGVTQVSWNNVHTPVAVGNFDDSAWVFTAQAIIGISIKIMEGLFIECDYRYFRPWDVELTDSTGDVGCLENQHLHIVQIGIKYRF